MPRAWAQVRPLQHYLKVFRFSQRTSDVQWHALKSLCLHGDVRSIRWLRYRRALSKDWQDIHSYRKYLPTLCSGSTSAYRQKWHWACIQSGYLLTRSSCAHMVSPKKFRREVCSNNPRLIVSFCAVCNRKAASGDLRLLVLAENLHECWPNKSERMPPTQGSLKTKPG
jgi:hypothetical protein